VVIALSVELSLLNAVIASRDFSLLVRSGLADESTWHEYPEAYRFIHDHVREFGETPSIESVVEASVVKRWPNEFERVETVESFETLSRKKHDLDAKVAARRLLESAAKKYGETSGVELVAMMERQIREIRDRLSLRNGEAINWTTTAKERLSDYIAKVENGVEDERIPLFWPQIDDAVGGFKRGHYVAVVAGTKRGKTWLATIAAEAASRAGFDVLVLIGEGSVDESRTRLDSYMFGLNSRRLEGYRLTDDEFSRYKSGLESLNDGKRGSIILEDYDSWPNGFTEEQVEASIDRYRPALVILDQFNLMEGSMKWEEQRRRSSRLRKMFVQKHVIGMVITQTGGDYVKETTKDDTTRELRIPSAGDYGGTIAIIQDCTQLIGFDSVQWQDEHDGKWRGKALAGVVLSRFGGAGTLVDLDFTPADGIIRPREPRRAEDAF
jgi:KaiC/GvpD/RAD55 family RecA-like ATPase